MNISDEMVERALKTWFADDPDWQYDYDLSACRHDMRRVLEELFAATPPPNTIPVRIAVAFDTHGLPDVRVLMPEVPGYIAWNILAEGGHTQRSCIATIAAPLPAVPEVGAEVEGA